MSLPSRMFVGVLVFALIGGCDYVRVQDAVGDVGLLVDGRNRSDSAIVNDRGRTRDATGEISISVGSLALASSPNKNEAIAFGEDRAPVRVSTDWTDSTGDEFPVALASILSLPVTVWIVQGPFASQRDHAIDACIQTASIWDAERMGVRFSSFVVRDATSDPDIDDAILNSVGGDARNWDDFSDNIGFDAGRINIYWINTVNGSTTTGWSDFGARIVMGRNTGDELLVHEIGHGFSLRHPRSCGGSTADFDATNVMWPCSSSREYLTEGQVFRSHFNTSSSVNNLYNARPGQPTLNCQTANQSPACPGLTRRLWDDGTYLSN